MQQALGQVIGDAPAAHQHHLPHAAAHDAQVFQQAGKVGPGGRHMDMVARGQHIVAVRDGDGPAVRHRAHQHLHAGDGIQLRKRHAAQAAALVHAQLYNFHPALGKRLALNKAGELQQAENFAGGGQLGVDAHREAQLFAHQKKLLGIFIAAHARNGVQPGVQALCHKAAQNVRLVCAGGGNQQVCVCGARLAQRAQRRGVARHG